MKKIIKLNLELSKLESQKQNFKSLENVSIHEFIKYKHILSKQKKISSQIEKMISLGEEINFWYDTQNNSWIQNPNISCKKYFRLEKHAAYKKNLKLYQLGLLDKKPLPIFLQDIIKISSSVKEKFNPIIKKINSKLPKFDLSKFVFIQKIINKHHYLKSIFIPNKINTIAVNTAKIGIKGYRKLQANYRFVRHFFKSKNSFKYVKNVINEANHLISLEEKKQRFKQSLQVSPSVLKQNIKSESKISISQKDISKNDYEYSL